MLRGIDISNHQYWNATFDIASARPGFVIAKATEGIGFVDKSCDYFVRKALKAGIPFGFYHFARGNVAAKEATYFYENTKGYVGEGIPVLDLEVPNGNAWLETWCRTYHDLSGVYPWVYMSSDYINNRGYGTDWVREHCGLWLAGYPTRATSYPSDTTCPYRHSRWTLAAWQFTDRLSMGGMDVDGDIFYGDEKAWAAYAGSGSDSGSATDSGNGSDSGIADADLEPVEVWQAARRVISGEFGTGDARRAALGRNYDTIQGAVNLLLSGSDNALAQVVIRGAMGDGDTRKIILGSRYAKVQARVNQLVRK